MQARATIESLTGDHGPATFQLEGAVPQDAAGLVSMGKAASAALLEADLEHEGLGHAGR